MRMGNIVRVLEPVVPIRVPEFCFFSSEGPPRRRPSQLHCLERWTADAHLAFRQGALASQSPAMIEPYGITSSMTSPRPYFAICERTDAAFL